MNRDKYKNHPDYVVVRLNYEPDPEEGIPNYPEHNVTLIIPDKDTYLVTLRRPKYEPKR